MSAWLLAGLALVAVVALIVAWRMRRAALLWRQLAAEAELAMHQAQEVLEQSRVNSALGEALVAVAGRLPASTATDPAGAGETVALDAARRTLAQHALRVREYDDAVQYCLQPVELIPGADEADLEHLMKFVSDARRRLFEARAQLMQGDALQHLPELIPAPTPAPVAAPDPLEALAGLAAATHGGTDIATLLEDLATLTRARRGDQATLSLLAADLPPVLAPVWLGTALLRLLDLVAGVADGEGEIVLRAQARDDHGVDIEAHGQASHSRPAETFSEFESALEDMRHRLDERGVVLEAVSLDPRSRGFVLHLPTASSTALPASPTDA